MPPTIGPTKRFLDLLAASLREGVTGMIGAALVDCGMPRFLRDVRCHDQDRGHDLARHVGGQQPIAVLAEHRGNPDRIVNAQSHEPPQQQIAIHLLHQLPRGPDREKIWRKCARITRSGAMARAAKVGVEHIEIGIQARACIVHDPPDLAKWMVRRNSLFKVKIPEQRTARFVRPTQRHPHRRCRNKGESCSGRRVEAGLFQQSVNSQLRKADPTCA